MDAVSYKVEAVEARILMISVEKMISRVLQWMRDIPNIEHEEVTKCQVGIHPIEPLSVLRPSFSLHSSLCLTVP